MDNFDLSKLRVEKTNTFLRKASHYKNCKRLKGDKCEEPHCQYSRCVLNTADLSKAGFFCNRDGE